MKKLLALIALCLSCTATEKAALKDCALRVLPIQIISVAAECGTDKDCAAKVAKERALIAAEYIATCVDSKDDGGAR